MSEPAKPEVWRCPKCGTRWVGDMVPTWRAEGQCGRCLASDLQDGKLPSWLQRELNRRPPP